MQGSGEPFLEKPFLATVGSRVSRRMLSGLLAPLALTAVLLLTAACGSKSSGKPSGPMSQAMPVQVQAVTVTPVPVSDQYVATIKSRRSATISPQVDGNLTSINVHSGQSVRAGQMLMEIDPAKQMAATAAAKATEQQDLATYQYNQVEVVRQRKLFAAGVTSRDVMDQAEQAYKNSKAAYLSAAASASSQEKQLGYYRIRAPFSGIVGDIPVHLGDYVSAGNLLTTVDENRDLEAYIFVPAALSSRIRSGLAVQILDNSGKQIEQTRIDFVSPQVDSQLQGILVKAPVHSSKVRNLEQVQARIVWSTEQRPVVPVLAVTRFGGQPFVFVAVEKQGKYFVEQRPIQIGDTVGNDYAVLSGLQSGEKVVVSNTQFLMSGMPVKPMG